MHYYEVAPNQIVRAKNVSFTYASDTPLPIGQIVHVEVGKKTLVGIVLKKVKKPPYETKHVTNIIEQTPLPKPIIALALWLSTYYGTHLATVLQTILPRGVHKSRRIRTTSENPPLRIRTKKVFTPEQSSAIETIAAIPSGSAILHGVTGSGKTAVYIELARRTLTKNKSVIVLVPEIALTSQLVDEFSHQFKDIILTHSRQTEAERHTAWRGALTSPESRIVIGPRSALFLPLQSIGLIIIDEAHEPSFKQEQSPRYSAIRAASILATHHNAKLILGSATPSVADYYIAQQSGRPILQMNNRAQKNATAPKIDVIDMTKHTNFKKHRFLSDKLLATLDNTFAKNHQALIFHNRRGSASTTLCEACGWSATCPTCFIPFTLHVDNHQLQCHICGHGKKIPTSCPECHSTDILHRGIGTKLIESELRRLYPNKKIARFDGDNAAGESIEKKYHELYSGEIDLIIGTQIVAKGLDLPKLRSVGVIQADAGLSLPDYSSSERTFQLIAQVVGRVGRSNHDTDIVIQSYQPDHPAVTSGLAQDYARFYTDTLHTRRQGQFPPFVHLLKLTCVYKTESAAIKNAKKLALLLYQRLPSSIQILGPTPAFYERQHDTYRWQLILKSQKRAELVAALEHVPPTHWQAELDPISLL